MTDIVAALREGIEPYEGISAAEQIMEMAADEIERLRAEIERLRAELKAWQNAYQRT